MIQQYNLQRFLDAQENTYSRAYSELDQGRKQSHWMWFIFPQILGLGQSETSKFYGIKSLEEATLFLSHPILGSRLISISNLLLKLETNDPQSVFGSPDDLKLFSSMTLFNHIPNADPVFQKVLNKYFCGKEDIKTLNITAGHHYYK